MYRSLIIIVTDMRFFILYVDYRLFKLYRPIKLVYSRVIFIYLEIRIMAAIRCLWTNEDEKKQLDWVLYFFQYNNNNNLTKCQII